MGTEIEVDEILTVPISTSATSSKKHFEWTPARKEAFEKCILARNEALRKRKEAEKDGIELPPKPKKSSSKNKSATVVSSLPPPPPTPTPLPSAPVLPPIGTVKKEDPLKKRRSSVIPKPNRSCVNVSNLAVFECMNPSVLSKFTWLLVIK